MEGIIEYFKRITKFTPTPEQIEVLEALIDVNTKNLCLCCGRGFSKTMLSALAALWFADIYSDEIHRPLEILLVSGQQRMYKHLNDFFRTNPQLSDRLLQKGMFNEVPENGFELDNHSVVDTALATSKGIRSHRADIIFVDEACLVKDDIFRQAILPVSTGDIAKIVILSTPSEPRGFFIDVLDNPVKYGYVVKHFSAETCPWQTVSNARLKKTLSPVEYLIEVKAQIPGRAERAFFTRKDVDKCVLSVEPVAENKERSALEAGIDWGYGRVNQTVLTITEKNGIKRKIIFQKVWRDVDFEGIADCLRGFRGLIKADSKPPEFKGKLEQYLGKGIIIHYLDMVQHKEPLITQLQTKVRMHQLAIPDIFADLVRELVTYRRGKRAGDNRVDSLAISCYEPKEGLGPETPSKVYIPTQEGLEYHPQKPSQQELDRFIEDYRNLLARRPLKYYKSADLLIQAKPLFKRFYLNELQENLVTR